MRAKQIGPKSPCTVDGCNKPYLARGYCAAHWALWRKYGKPEKLARTSLEECSVEGCSKAPRSTYAKYCDTHYCRLRRTGTTDERLIIYVAEVLRPSAPRRVPELQPKLKPILRASGPCLADGCDRAMKFVETGFCRLHHMRFKARGDEHFEFKGENNNRWTGADASSGAVHQRIRKQRGPASSWSCTDCARPAQHWSYNRTDPDQRHDPKRGPYSVDMDHYFPRCVRCHKAFDMKHVMAERAT